MTRMLPLIFMFHATLGFANNSITIQLEAEEVPSFEGWMLRLDDNRLFSFDETGRMELLQPEGISFEIIDKQQEVRFLGAWKQFNDRKKITIEVYGDSLNVRQVVSASRIRQDAYAVAGEIEVIRPEDQKERAAVQTSDWLKEQAEVLLQKTNLGGGAPIMRGMSGNRVLLMVDGFRLNNATFRLGLNQYLNTYAGSQLEQIEVLSGPSGVQYGSDGLGGTIHLRSNDPASTEGEYYGYHGFLSTADGTNTHRLTANGDAGKLHYQTHFTFNKYEDLKAADPIDDQTPTGYDAWDGSLNLTYKLNEASRLRLINTASQARHVPRTDRILSGRDLVWEYHPQNLYLHGLRFETRPKGDWADFFEIGAGYLRQEEGNVRVSTNSPDVQTVTDTRVETMQYNGTFTKIGEHLHYVYGFDVQQDSVSAKGSREDLPTGNLSSEPGKFPNDSAYTSYGMFLTVEREIAKSLFLKGGLRGTWVNLKGTLEEPIGSVDENFSQLTPSLTLSKKGSRYFWSLGISQGFRAPNLEDTLTLGPSNRGFDAPNPNLEPEELTSYESTLRLRGKGRLFQITAYTSHYESLIERVPGSYQGQTEIDGEPIFILDNVGEARIEGLSMQFQQELTTRQMLRLDAAWTEGTQTDLDVPMTRIPPLRGNLSWSYKADNWLLSSVLTWADRQDRLSPGDVDDSRIPEDGTPGYGALHLRGRYNIGEHFSLNLAAENLTDKLYKHHGSGIYEPGRRLLLELDVRFK